MMELGNVGLSRWVDGGKEAGHVVLDGPQDHLAALSR